MVVDPGTQLSAPSDAESTTSAREPFDQQWVESALLDPKDMSLLRWIVDFFDVWLLSFALAVFVMFMYGIAMLVGWLTSPT